MSKFLDLDGLLYLWSKIKALTGGKVDKVEGKGLSTNDFTTAEKTKLEGLHNVISAYSPGDVNESLTTGELINTAQSEDHVIYAVPKVATTTGWGVVKVGEGLQATNGVLSVVGGGSADSVDWSNIQNKPDVALKSDLSTVYRYKGSVANYASLPAEDNAVGDVWNVEATGMNYAWTGDSWDALGETVQIESITNAEIDTITAG